jgi:signal transduction histidine kinase
MRGLRGSSGEESGLVPAVRRFATKFAETTCLNVHVDAAHDLKVNDRLAAELFQMVAEGLSNIRRHTHATQATIKMLNEGTALCCVLRTMFRKQHHRCRLRHSRSRNEPQRSVAAHALSRIAVQPLW